ncbi:PIN domain-containing protein [Gamsiella multidivaricata]|uniref:PIN domain-containing protein n=1 Tax=Gamsiella multidivaricata TaxID=101098 RepID=UPI00221F1218|nr:PIN domain-containing protein [Gamsiella multidivaricata]KAI7817729.1 PIN domain-containing protein [Gamsiella multidivaricata]
MQSLSLKQNSKARQVALAHATLEDCEGSFLILHAMLFEKINLDNFEKRLKNFSKQLKALHTQRNRSDMVKDQEMQPTQPTQPKRWDGFYFMQAVINIAAVYEFNWSASVIAKSNTAFGSLADHLATVATLPYSSKLLLSTMEQSMRRYLTSVDNINSKVASTPLEEQQGWLVYCHVILVWMAGRPFGSGNDMVVNWRMMADHMTLPTFWTTLTTFMNHHWNRLTPFEQSDMLSAISEELTDSAATDSSHGQGQDQEKSFYRLSLPPLGQEWELRGLAWMPAARFGPQMFKGPQPALDDTELKGDSLWKQESLKAEHLSKRLVELSLIAAMHMKIIEFDFCENAFKICDEYAGEVENAAAAANQHHSGLPAFASTEEYSTDDNLMPLSHASISQDSGIEDDDAALFSSDGTDYSTAEIMELKSKRDLLKSLLSDSNASGRKTVSLGSLQRDYRARPSSSLSGHGRKNKNSGGGGRGYMDRRNYHGQGEQRVSIQRGAMVGDNSTLVIDTNCLVADWTVIQRVVAADRWTVIIPLAVITELDGLKNNPAPLGPSAAAALSYLEGCLAMRPKLRRLKIQTSRGNYMNDLSFRVESFNYEKQQQQHQSHHRRAASGGGGSGLAGTGAGYDDREEENYESDEEIMRNHNVDDFILGLCLWHQENGSVSSSSSSSLSSPMMGSPSAGPGIFLVTDDRNLRVKARARSVEVLGKDDLVWMTGHGSALR